VNWTSGCSVRILRWLGSTAATALLLAACSGEVVGPLGESADAPRPACFEAGPGGALTKHVATFTAPEELRLTDLRLDGAHGIEALDPVLLPFSGNPAVTGTFLRYPPGAGVIADSLMRWSERQPVEDALVTEADGQLAVLVGLRLTDSAVDGELEGFRIDYTDADGSEFTRDYAAPLVLKATGDVCTAADYD
jgi:hypothetical protein